MKSRKVHVSCSLAVYQTAFNYLKYSEFGEEFTIISSLFFLLGFFYSVACLQKSQVCTFGLSPLAPASELNAFRV